MVEEAVKVAEDRIRQHLPDLVDRAIDLALGVVVQEEYLENGALRTRIYARPPDARALMYVLDRVMGKPAQRVEMTGQTSVAPVIVTMMPRLQAIAQGLMDGTSQES